MARVMSARIPKRNNWCQLTPWRMSESLSQFDAIYASGRLQLPFNGVLLVDTNAHISGRGDDGLSSDVTAIVTLCRRHHQRSRRNMATVCALSEARSSTFRRTVTTSTTSIASSHT